MATVSSLSGSSHKGAETAACVDGAGSVAGFQDHVGDTVRWWTEVSRAAWLTPCVTNCGSRQVMSCWGDWRIVAA